VKLLGLLEAREKLPLVLALLKDRRPAGGTSACSGATSSRLASSAAMR